MASALPPVRIEVDSRHAHQNAALSIHDVYDAIVELVTNADDRYQLLECPGRIHIEVQRRRGKPSTLRIRDFADGMTSEVMRKKLARIGGRVSGMERGKDVRGTNARGAKDIAVLGQVTFESIGEDGRYHRSDITRHLDFVPYKSEPVTRAIRTDLGIQRGTGTVVTLAVVSDYTIPRHDKMKKELRDLVSLRGILSDPDRTVTLRDLQQDREDRILFKSVEGTTRVKTPLTVPGYPDAKAKLVVCRAKRRFGRSSPRFRHGGIVIKSRHAVHEATLFDSGLETDPHAAWFYGTLTCPYIDDLSNEFDECFAKREQNSPLNPRPIVDPGRRHGLTREHPFVQKLFGEALKQLRPLVEEERKREESERARVESHATRRRLNKLEKAAAKFIEEHHEQDESARDPNAPQTDTSFRRKGFAINPPFAKLVKGSSRKFWIAIHQDSFPELQVGTNVVIEALSDDIRCDKHICGLEPHPQQAGVLRAVWNVTAVNQTPATGIRVRVDPVLAESIIEVLETEADRFGHIEQLQFSKKLYRVHAGSKKKKIRILAPIELAPTATELDLVVSDSKFKILGRPTLKPKPQWGISIADVGIRFDGIEATASITAKLAGQESIANLKGVQPQGAGLTIKLEDIDHGNQRYRWKGNVLEIAARHASLRRYLGKKEDNFPGQEDLHFRVLLAEIVAEAVAGKIIALNETNAPEDYEDADWDQYYADFTDYMTQFLPLAHSLQCPAPTG